MLLIQFLFYFFQKRIESIIQKHQSNMSAQFFVTQSDTSAAINGQLLDAKILSKLLLLLKSL